MAAIRLVLSDYDRTFTDGTLRIEPGLLETIGRLRRKGVLFSLVSGRKSEFMEAFDRASPGLLDSYVAENGCVGYAGKQKHYLARPGDQASLLAELELRAVPFDAGEVVVSVSREFTPAVDRLLPSFPWLYAVRNVDSLMILPRGVSKASGIEWLLDFYGLTAGQTACIGDAENDLAMRGFCSLLGAVENALPALKAEADYVCRYSFGRGLQEFLEHIEGTRG